MMPWFANLQKIWNLFMKKLLTLPPSTPAALVRPGLDLPSIWLLVHIALINYWQKLRRVPTSHHSSLYFTLFQQDPIWIPIYNTIVHLYKLPNVISGRGGHSDWCQLSGWDISTWYHFWQASSKFSSWFKLTLKDQNRARYISETTFYKVRSALTTICFHTMQCIPKLGTPKAIYTAVGLEIKRRP